MPHPSSQPARDFTADDGATLARVGRRIGVVLFWLLAVYVAGGSALSIIPSLYGGGRSAGRHAPAVARCARGIEALDRALTDAGAAQTSRPSPRSRASLAAWDRRYLALGVDCGPLEQARRDLGVLRIRTEGATDGAATESDVLRARIRAALQDHSAPDPEPNQEG